MYQPFDYGGEYLEEPEEIIMHMLTAATEFYNGSWAGILDAALVTKVLPPPWSYNHKTITPSIFGNFQVYDVRSSIVLSSARITKAHTLNNMNLLKHRLYSPDS